MTSVREKSMRSLLGIIAALCLIAMPPQAHAAKRPKVTKAASPVKERLVLMPLRVGEENQSMLGAMETALVEGLEPKYQVFSGDRVMLKVKEIFNKESHNAKKDCDETRCMENIAMAFQADLIASANVTKIEGGYLLSLNIRNVEFDKSVYSKSTPCKGCDAFQVIDKLKELSGSPVPGTSQASTSVVDETPSPSGNANDPENALWGEVQKGNSADDYDAYLTQYPKGKFIALARIRLKKLKEQDAAATKKQQEQAAAQLAQQDRSAWDSANGAATAASYQGYLILYPQGSYATLAQARIAKLQKEAAIASERAQQQAETERKQREAQAASRSTAMASATYIQASYGNMPELAKRHNCTACHAIGKKVVGPAWIDVSRRYKGDASAEAKLIAKVSMGGSGSWGSMPMPANDPAGVKQADIRGLVQFILGLDK